MKRLALAACFACVSIAFADAGCGGGGGGKDTPVLSLSPATVDLTVENGVAPTQAFTATVTHGNGSTEDVTADTEFFIQSSYGSFAGATLTANAAGETTVQGTWNGQTAEASVVIHAHSVRVAPGLSNSVPGLFDAPEQSSPAPTVLYPPAGATMLRNMGRFDVHWIDTSGSDVFEISLHSPLTDVRAYVTGSAGDAAVGAGAAWATLLPEEWAEAVSHQPSVEVQLRGVNTASPSAVWAAPPISIDLPNEMVTGGLYYWAAAGTTPAIMRHDLEQPDVQAQPFLPAAPAGCVGCHSISRDGSHMAVCYMPGGQATVEDITTGTVAPAIANWTFATFTPDASEVLTVTNGVLDVRSTDTQAVLGTMTSAGYVSQPDLSPDGTRLVYVVTPSAPNDWTISNGVIAWRTFDQTTNTFGAETALVDDGQNNYYPSYSPDGAWVLYNSVSGGGASYSDPDTALRVVDADGALPSIPLDQFNGVPGTTTSWARWAPYSATTAAGEPVFWLTVSSRRDFGTRLHAPINPQIWMSPFFPDRATAGDDPSGPGFWLPFQDIASDNHIAQWTQRILSVSTAAVAAP